MESGVGLMVFLGDAEEGVGGFFGDEIVKFFAGFEEGFWEFLGLLAWGPLGLLWEIISRTGLVGLRSQRGFGFGIGIGVGGLGHKVWAVCVELFTFFQKSLYVILRAGVDRLAWERFSFGGLLREFINFRNIFFLV